MEEMDMKVCQIKKKNKGKKNPIKVIVKHKY